VSIRSHSHPWCEYPAAPHDHTHTHTAAIGSVQLPTDNTAEVVLAQPWQEAPMLTMHITGSVGRISLYIDGGHAWALAGLLIDATVAHRQAVPEPAEAADQDGQPGTGPASRSPVPWPVRRARARRTGRVVRCQPRRSSEAD
jgi:hypothetical protein